MKLNNKYFILRHGQAISNVKEILSSWPEKFKNPLTAWGREMIKRSADELVDICAKQGRVIDLIFASDLLRTKQTAEIMGKELNIKPRFDKRLRELGFGVFNSKSMHDYHNQFKSDQERIKKGVKGGENYTDVLDRVYGFLKETDKKYKNKSILIVSHECPLWLLEAKVRGLTLKQTTEIPFQDRIHKGQIKDLN